MPRENRKNDDSRGNNNKAASKKIHIPDELMQFVQRDTYSLLIKGYAGTGKTTLSLTILRALNIRSNFFYISTRISPKQLFLYYPWIRKFISNPIATETNNSDSETEQLLDQPSFEDARLDEPESLFERITNQLMDVKSPIIIIDSWDAIASYMDREARINNERVLQTWRERAGAKLIFISEDPKDTTLDFLVDGIVELEQKYYENTRIREIFLSKLRGVRINKPSYIYTLDNAIFRSYNHYHPTEYLIQPNHKQYKQYKSTPPIDFSDYYIRTGFAGLDSALGGGFPRKGIVAIEMDSLLSTRVAMTFLAGIMSNFIGSNNPVLFCPFEGVDPKMVISILESRLSSLPKNIMLKILWPSYENNQISDYIVPYNIKSDLGLQCVTYEQTLAKLRQNYPNKILLNITGIEICKNLTGQAKIGRAEAASFLRANSDLTIVVSKHAHDLREQLAEAPDVYLKFLIINGTLFVQSLSPWTHLYAIVIDGSLGYPEIKLEPVV